LQRIVDAHPDGRVVAVVHGGVIGQLLHHITQSRRFAFSGADNASISEIVVTHERTVLRRYNDTSHLD
jgi:probable phosphoglycerate mutase